MTTHTTVETYGPFAIVRVDFQLARDRFYTVEYTGPETIHTGNVFRTFHYLRNARKLAKQLANASVTPMLANLGRLASMASEHDPRMCGECTEAEYR